MKSLNPYLNFKDTCRQAMNFYQKCLGGEVSFMTFAESPMPATEAEKNKIMHARLQRGNVILMASDCPPGENLQTGNNVHLSLDCETVIELQQTFAALSEKGKVVLPPQDMFWGSHFGMLTDQFGIHWMLNCEKK